MPAGNYLLFCLSIYTKRLCILDIYISLKLKFHCHFTADFGLEFNIVSSKFLLCHL